MHGVLHWCVNALRLYGTLCERVSPTHPCGTAASPTRCLPPRTQGRKNIHAEYTPLKTVCAAIEADLSTAGYHSTNNSVTKNTLLMRVIADWESKRKAAKTFASLYKSISAQKNDARVASGGQDRSWKRRKGGAGGGEGGAGAGEMEAQDGQQLQ